MSDKPILSPIASVLSDDKTILVLIGMVVEVAVNLVPELKPYAQGITVIAFILFAFLVAHQGIEDIIAALGEYRLVIAPTQPTTTTVVAASDATVVKTEAPPSGVVVASDEAAG